MTGSSTTFLQYFLFVQQSIAPKIITDNSHTLLLHTWNTPISLHSMYTWLDIVKLQPKRFDLIITYYISHKYFMCKRPKIINYVFKVVKGQCFQVCFMRNHFPIYIPHNNLLRFSFCPKASQVVCLNRLAQVD